MKKTPRRLALILILLLAMSIALAACDLSGVSEALKTDVSKCDVTFSASAYEYTGQEIRPEVSVKYFNKVLEVNTDYEIEYYENIEKGEDKAKSRLRARAISTERRPKSLTSLRIWKIKIQVCQAEIFRNRPKAKILSSTRFPQTEHNLSTEVFLKR